MRQVRAEMGNIYKYKNRSNEDIKLKDNNLKISVN